MTDQEPKPASRIRAVRLLIDKGAGRYDGSRHLERLLGGGGEIWRGAASDPAASIARLKRALRSQRQLGRAGHWSYDLNRHFGLLQARNQAIATAGDRNAGASTTSGISETGTETS